jgi:hypothetical protein
MTREQAINYLFSCGFTNEQVGEVVRALTYEPTTKNNLGVDCISRDSAIKALDYDIKSFDFKSGVSKHMDDIAKLLNTIYEIQVNNIKALSSVTPQEPTDKKFTKADIDAIVKAINEGWELRVNEILGKIRAEIEKLRPNLRPEQMTDYDYAMVEVVDDIVAILDKYKAEQEET